MEANEDVRASAVKVEMREYTDVCMHACMYLFLGLYVGIYV
jgi:hypothetical protein